MTTHTYILFMSALTLLCLSSANSYAGASFAIPSAKSEPLKLRIRSTPKPAETQEKKPSQANSNAKGGVCTRGDRDSMKCMMCVVAFEGRIESYEGMKAVGQVVMTRLNNPKYPNTVCGVVHQSGQFVALNRSRQLPGGEDLERIRRAAAAALSSGGNGYLGFRSYGGNGAVKSIGGNHFRRTGELELIDKEPTPVNQQPRVQMATLLEDNNDAGAAR